MFKWEFFLNHLKHPTNLPTYSLCNLFIIRKDKRNQLKKGFVYSIYWSYSIHLCWFKSYQRFLSSCILYTIDILIHLFDKVVGIYIFIALSFNLFAATTICGHQEIQTWLCHFQQWKCVLGIWKRDSFLGIVIKHLKHHCNL